MLDDNANFSKEQRWSFLNSKDPDPCCFAKVQRGLALASGNRFASYQMEEMY